MLHGLVNCPEMPALKSDPTAAEAEVLALDALKFLAGDPDRLGRFLALTGIGPADLMARAAEPQLLAGVLDHLLADESLLHLCAVETGVPVDRIVAARRRLPGAQFSA